MLIFFTYIKEVASYKEFNLICGCLQKINLIKISHSAKRLDLLKTFPGENLISHYLYIVYTVRLVWYNAVVHLSLCPPHRLMDELGIDKDSGSVSFGQLLGMCDHVSLTLGELCTHTHTCTHTHAHTCAQQTWLL